MSGERKNDNVDWEQVFSKGAYCIGGGFMVGCGLSVLTSSTWPVLFSTGVGMGLACVHLESQMWNKGRKDSMTFENPSLKRRSSESDENIGKWESSRSLERPFEDKDRGDESRGREKPDSDVNREKDYWDKAAKPCPSAPKKKAQKGKKNPHDEAQVEADPSLLVD